MNEHSETTEQNLFINNEHLLSRDGGSIWPIQRFWNNNLLSHVNRTPICMANSYFWKVIYEGDLRLSHAIYIRIYQPQCLSPPFVDLIWSRSPHDISIEWFNGQKVRRGKNPHLNKIYLYHCQHQEREKKKSGLRSRVKGTWFNWRTEKGMRKLCRPRKHQRQRINKKQSRGLPTNFVQGIVKVRK